MRKPLALLLAGSTLVGGVAVAEAATKTIKMGDNWFVRASGAPTVTVSKGTTVRWKNVGNAPHNVVVSKGPAKFRSNIVRSGGSYKKKVRRRGTYRIFCSIHGKSDQSMKLVVR